jgi:AcrR family transcriptional regulator
MTTRDRIVDAAARVMRTEGLAGATTKEIARAAGLSEAALYKHFRDKEELFLHVLHDRLPPFVWLVKELPERGGRETVAGNLEEVARMAVRFYEESIPLGAALFAEPQLLARHREALLAVDAGPHRAIDLVAGYVRAEQEAGRAASTVGAETAASLLLGACFQRAYLRSFVGPEAAPGSDEGFAAGVAQAVARSLSA